MKAQRSTNKPVAHLSGLAPDKKRPLAVVSSVRRPSDGRVVRAEAKRALRRTEILNTALEVFGEKGYQKASITDVIEAAGIARGTFYLYFESKTSIFLELLDRLTKQLRESVVGVEYGEGLAPMEEQLHGTIKRVVETVASNRSFVTVLLREPVGLDPEVDLRLGRFYENLRVFIQAALERGMRLGIVRSLDAVITASCILGSIKHVLEQHLLGPHPLTPNASDSFAMSKNGKGGGLIRGSTAGGTVPDIRHRDAKVLVGVTSDPDIDRVVQAVVAYNVFGVLDHGR